MEGYQEGRKNRMRERREERNRSWNSEGEGIDYRVKALSKSAQSKRKKRTLNATTSILETLRLTPSYCLACGLPNSFKISLCTFIRSSLISHRATSSEDGRAAIARVYSWLSAVIHIHQLGHVSHHPLHARRIFPSLLRGWSQQETITHPSSVPCPNDSYSSTGFTPSSSLSCACHLFYLLFTSVH